MWLTLTCMIIDKRVASSNNSTGSCVLDVESSYSENMGVADAPGKHVWWTRSENVGVADAPGKRWM